MAVKKSKKKKESAELTLWDVILSYPDLHDPKPYKGKIYYRTDCLLGEDHSQLGELRAAIKKVRTNAFGADKTEWPDGAKKVFIHNGDEREDQPAYKDKLYITASTQTPVPVVDLKGKAFNTQAVKGGMFANVAIRISAWEFDGDMGISIYLSGVQIITNKKSLNFGGGKAVEDMFKRTKGSSMEDAEEEEQEDDGDDQPRGKKSSKKKSKKSSDDEE